MPNQVGAIDSAPSSAPALPGDMPPRRPEDNCSVPASPISAMSGTGSMDGKTMISAVRKKTGYWLERIIRGEARQPHRGFCNFLEFHVYLLENRRHVSPPGCVPGRVKWMTLCHGAPTLAGFHQTCCYSAASGLCEIRDRRRPGDENQFTPRGAIAFWATRGDTPFGISTRRQPMALTPRPSDSSTHNYVV
jgi:hypothetical protein